MTQPPVPASADFVQRHPGTIVLLHWLTFALVVLGVTLVLIQDEVGARELKHALLAQHRSVGLALLALAGLRLATRIWKRGRMVRHELPLAVRVTSAVGHYGLYILLVVTPVLGWALTSANGQQANLFGLVALPPLMAPDEDWAEILSDWHALCAWSLLGLISAHAAAALWHHFVRRDGVLTAMLPWKVGTR